MSVAILAQAVSRSNLATSLTNLSRSALNCIAPHANQDRKVMVARVLFILWLSMSPQCDTVTHPRLMRRETRQPGAKRRQETIHVKPYKSTIDEAMTINENGLTSLVVNNRTVVEKTGWGSRRRRRRTPTPTPPTPAPTTTTGPTPAPTSAPDGCRSEGFPRTGYSEG